MQRDKPSAQFHRYAGGCNDLPFALALAAATVSAKGREQEIKKRECSFDEVCVKNRLYVEL